MTCSLPGAAIRSAQFANRESENRVIGLQQGGEFSPQGLSKVYIEAAGGYMDVRIDNQSLPWRERAFNAAYPLHTARLDNLGYKLLMSLVVAVGGIHQRAGIARIHPVPADPMSSLPRCGSSEDAAHCR